MVQPLAIPALIDNYFWAFALPSGRDAVVVDPGDAAPVERLLAERGWRPRVVLITHHHPDHIGGLAEIVARHAPVVIGPDDPRVPCVTRIARDGDRLDEVLEGLRGEVLFVPGHTRSHVAYRIGEDALFCGDTLFSVGCGRMFEGTAAQMLASIDKLDALPAHTRLYCAHEYTAANCRFALSIEPDNVELRARDAEVRARRARGEATVPTTLAAERATNPFLRCDLPAVRETVTRRAPEARTRVDIFAALRARKDVFA